MVVPWGFVCVSGLDGEVLLRFVCDEDCVELVGGSVLLPVVGREFTFCVGAVGVAVVLNCFQDVVGNL